MGIVEAIIGAILAIFKAIPIFDKWFSKTPTEKLEAEKKKLDEEEAKLKESGRPEW